MSLMSPPYPPMFDAPFFETGLPIPIGGGLRNVGGNDTLDGGAGNDIMIGDGRHDPRHGAWRQRHDAAAATATTVCTATPIPASSPSPPGAVISGRRHRQFCLGRR